MRFLYRVIKLLNRIVCLFSQNISLQQTYQRCDIYRCPTASSPIKSSLKSSPKSSRKSLQVETDKCHTQHKCWCLNLDTHWVQETSNQLLLFLFVTLLFLTLFLLLFWCNSWIKNDFCKVYEEIFHLILSESSILHGHLSELKYARWCVLSFLFWLCILLFYVLVSSETLVVTFCIVVEA